MNQVSNDNIHQGVKIVSSDKDINSLLNVVKEKVGDFLFNMCSTFQNNSYNSTSKCIMGCYTFIPLGHRNKWVPRLSMV